MPSRYAVALLLTSGVANLALAQDFKPFPRANITTQQWSAYFEEVRTKHGSSVQDLEAQKLLIFTDTSAMTMYAFTKPGHPAHPAWITRKPEQRNDSTYIAQIGYFAGDEAPFAQLFRAYITLNEKMKEDVQRRRADERKGQAASEPSR